jgi:hypothetical protein
MEEWELITKESCGTRRVSVASMVLGEISQIYIF